MLKYNYSYSLRKNRNVSEYHSKPISFSLEEEWENLTDIITEHKDKPNFRFSMEYS